MRQGAQRCSTGRLSPHVVLEAALSPEGQRLQDEAEHEEEREEYKAEQHNQSEAHALPLPTYGATAPLAGASLLHTPAQRRGAGGQVQAQARLGRWLRLRAGARNAG